MSYSYVVFVLLSAFFLAKLEIEIEGRQGWATGLPTWRVENHFLLDLLFGGRPLRGYHVWSLVLFLFLFHMPFFFYGSWSIRGELNVLGGYFLFWVVEDLLWFVMNPNFGLRKFDREHAWCTNVGFWAFLSSTGYSVLWLCFSWRSLDFRTTGHERTRNVNPEWGR